MRVELQRVVEFGLNKIPAMAGIFVLCDESGRNLPDAFPNVPQRLKPRRVGGFHVTAEAVTYREWC